MFCVYSRSDNVAMLWSPKSACTELRQLFYWLHEKDMLHERPTNQWHNIEKDFPTKANPDRAFYVSRHPFLRCISGYCHFFRQICSEQEAYRKPILAAFHRHMGANAKQTFRNFVIYLWRAAKAKDRSTNIHFRAQTDSVVSISWLKVKVIHLEKGNLDKEISDWYQANLGHDQYRSKINEFFATPHPKNITAKKRTEGSIRDIVNAELSSPFPLPEQFFDEGLVKMIEQAFSADYEFLGYKKGLINIPR